MAGLGLGACLADDMGLGKTIQLLVFLLHRLEANPLQGPTLLVCPTSVVGNWERELSRFAPDLPVLQHFGASRARDADAFTELLPGAVVITTYGLLRRDVEVLKTVPWTNVVLDEAQNIKNSASRTARAARALQAEFRVALTGTPVENRLSELWSISEFLNAGLLGRLEPFRRDIAIPIERYNRDDVAEKLKRVVRPFILRRVKSDPNVIQDLPSKQEMKVFCTLTREQASLYQAAVDESLESIESAEGIERRGRVLALITALKQICNHPAQYLDDANGLAGRSGKLERLSAMVDEVLAAGDRALIFTQYRAMGERLVRELTRIFGAAVPFLHGGVPKDARDVMVSRFQEESGPKLFVLSVKAGGTGLNLTAANHVFHFDRWWNPAVEDQATDRAYRIGQQRSVQVHKLMCAGTVEEKIDGMLEAKRDLADRIVGAGEQWITELDNAGLRELLALAPNAAIATEDADDNEPPERKPKRGRKRASRAGAVA
jgi:SNF2 family DNA or RNA helicase